MKRKGGLVKSPRSLLLASLVPCLLSSLASAQYVKGLCTEPWSLPSNSFQPIPFETNEERLDDRSMHDPKTFRTRFTATVDGAYLLFGTVVYEKQAGGYIRNLCIIKNADQVTGVLACNALTSPNDCFAYEGCAVSVAPTLTFLSAGDYVEFWGFQDTGKAVEIRHGPVGNSSSGVMIRMSASPPKRHDRR